MFINLYILLESIRETESVHFLSSPAFLKYLRIVQTLLLVYLTTICTEKAIVLTFILEMSWFLKNNLKLMHSLQNSKNQKPLSSYIWETEMHFIANCIHNIFISI